MRWKLQFLVSLAMTVVAVVLYSVARRISNGSFTFRDPFAGRDLLLLLVALVPAVAGGFFVYRHTPRNRMTQAGITIGVTLVLSAGVLFVLTRFL